jgi:hypothetical protein
VNSWMFLPKGSGENVRDRLQQTAELDVGLEPRPAFLSADASLPSQIMDVFFMVMASKQVSFKLVKRRPRDISSSNLNSLKSSIGPFVFLRIHRYQSQTGKRENER